jgi:hypothetical protein
MDDFSYLSVLVSIVLGLGITNLLTGLAVLIRRRTQIKIYWPAPVWIVTLFLIHVQTWWSMFGLKDVRVWNFGAFLVVLLQPVLLFIMTALITSASSRADGAFDPRAEYFRESRWFFAALILALCDSLLKNLVLYGRLPVMLNIAAHLVFIALAFVGIVWRNDKVHKILAPVALALLASYIALLFTTLS